MNDIEQMKLYWMYLLGDGLSVIMMVVEENGIVGNHYYFQNNSPWK